MTIKLNVAGVGWRVERKLKRRWEVFKSWGPVS